jgi:hypothetical protein
VICPDGQFCGNLVQPPAQEYFALQVLEIGSMVRPSRLGTRGVSRSSRNARRDAMDATACWTNAALGYGEVLFFTHWGRGCGGHPAFPAPSIFDEGGLPWLGRKAPRDRPCMSGSAASDAMTCNIQSARAMTHRKPYDCSRTGSRDRFIGSAVALALARPQNTCANDDDHINWNGTAHDCVMRIFRCSTRRRIAQISCRCVGLVAVRQA